MLEGVEVGGKLPFKKEQSMISFHGKKKILEKKLQYNPLPFGFNRLLTKILSLSLCKSYTRPRSGQLAGTSDKDGFCKMIVGIIEYSS